MGISVIEFEEQDKWDSVIKSFKTHDIYYLNGYADAFYVKGDGKPQLIYYEDQMMRAAQVVMKRDIALFPTLLGKIDINTYFDFTSPYGYGGFLMEGSNTESFFADYLRYCTENSIVSEFVRFNPLIKNWIELDKLYQIKHIGKTVRMDIQTEEKIWNNLSSKNRNMIRKAQRSGFKIYWGREPGLIDPFMRLYNKTMNKDGASRYYYFDRPFYESILEKLKNNAMWFYTAMEGEIVSIAIFLFENNNMHYHLSASNVSFNSLAPTNLLLYEAALWGNKNGYQSLHLGGGLGAQHDNLYKFKKAFNRNEDLDFYVGTKVFLPDMYETLVNLRIKTTDQIHDFFPEYRING